MPVVGLDLLLATLAGQYIASSFEGMKLLAFAGSRAGTHALLWDGGRQRCWLVAAPPDVPMPVEESTVRVVIANEPRVYRDVIATVVRHQRPHVDVVVCDPEVLGQEVSCRVPQLVVCSRLSNVVIRRSPAWVVLYPRQRSLAVISVAGRRMAVPQLEFADLLAIIDLAEQAVCPRSASTPGSAFGAVPPLLLPLRVPVEPGPEDL